MSKWTHFWDMHSGGGQKEKWAHIYIEAPEAEARVIFYNRFGHSPDRVTCTCCGEDYSVSEGESLEYLTAFHRNCEYGYVFVETGKRAEGETEWDKKKRVHTIKGRAVEGRYFEEQEQRKMKIRRDCNTPASDPWGLYQALAEYLKSGEGGVKVIRAKDIKKSERQGTVPAQGYVWQE